MKMKFKLHHLKVSSFTTDLEKNNADTVKGGAPTTIQSRKQCNTGLCSKGNACDSQFFFCETRNFLTCGGDSAPPVC